MEDDQVRDLVEGAQQGDHAAFEELVRGSYRAVFALALRLTGNEEDAGDVTQEAFVRAYKGLRRFRGDAKFSTWMYRITANCASTLMGRRARHGHEELLDDDTVIDLRPDSDPILHAEASMFRREFDKALLILPPRLRSVVVLRDVYDLSHREIAAQLDITESAAKVRLHRARHKLRDLLGRSAEPQVAKVEADLAIGDADGSEPVRRVG